MKMVKTDREPTTHMSYNGLRKWLVMK